VEGSAPSVEDFIELFFSNSDPQFTQLTEATIGDTLRVVLRMTTNGKLVNQIVNCVLKRLSGLLESDFRFPGGRENKIYY
jgi:hypothetical protein